MWWASDGPVAPQTPHSNDLTAARCLLWEAVSLLFILDARFSNTELGAAAVWFPFVVR